jgi:hypothetical protein
MNPGALPLMALASTLRVIGQNLLCNLLHGGQWPDWSVLLPLEQARMLVQPRASPAGRWKQGAADAQKEPASQYPLTVTQAIAGQTSTRRSHARIRGQFKRRFGGLPFTYLPDDLWPMLGELAWRDLDFQYWVAAQVRVYFRPRVLFRPGETPFARLSPETMWTLIALSGAEIPRRSRLFKPGRRRMLEAAMHRQNPRWRRALEAARHLRDADWRQTLEAARHSWNTEWPRALEAARRWWNMGWRQVPKAVRRLQDAGKRQALEASHWAGFWDQWIISEALHRWPDPPRPLDIELRDALLALPLLTITSPETQVRQEGQFRGKPEIRRLAALRWKQEMPEWFPDLCRDLLHQRDGDE